MNPRSLYIHVPFCLRRCSYCDFAVTATREPPVEAWLHAIAAELRGVHARIGATAPLLLDTVYVGGGTPSLMPVGMMSRMREALAPYATWTDAAEWTVEANPETLTRELAGDWQAAGVNRLSLGAQTFHEPALAWMGRMHGADGPGRAFAAARAAGIDDISIDLIFGLPARLGRDWAGDLARALELEPSHVSLYGLTAEPATPLGRWVADARETLPPEDSYEIEYRLAADTLRAAGFEHYEVSNFARPGRRSRHNTVYWQHQPYIGLGPGAHSYLPPVRSWNVRDWGEYQAQIAAGGTGTASDEKVEGESLELERIWLGLRAAPGLAHRREGGSGVIFSPAQLALLDEWQAVGLVEVGADHILPTTAGWLVLDRLAVELSERAESPASVSGAASAG